MRLELLAASPLLPVENQRGERTRHVRKACQDAMEQVPGPRWASSRTSASAFVSRSVRGRFLNADSIVLATDFYGHLQRRLSLQLAQSSHLFGQRSNCEIIFAKGDKWKFHFTNKGLSIWTDRNTNVMSTSFQLAGKCGH